MQNTTICVNLVTYRHSGKTIAATPAPASTADTSLATAQFLTTTTDSVTSSSASSAYHATATCYASG